MPQLTDEKIKEIATECLAKRPEDPITKWFSHCPDGMYDDRKSHTRYFIYKGFHYIVVSSMWVKDPIANLRLEEYLREPWEYYPDIPPKPPKS